MWQPNIYASSHLLIWNWIITAVGDCGIAVKNMPRAQGLALRSGFLGFSDGRHPHNWRAGRSRWNSRQWSLFFNPLSFYKHVRLDLSVELIDMKRIIGGKKAYRCLWLRFLEFWHCCVADITFKGIRYRTKGMIFFYKTLLLLTKATFIYSKIQ